jgi:hypothetical protein
MADNLILGYGRRYVKKWHIRVEICGKTINLRDNKPAGFLFRRTLAVSLKQPSIPRTAVKL